MKNQCVGSFLSAKSNQQGAVPQVVATTRRPIFILFASLLISCALSLKVNAQSGVSTGSILGFVTDTSGAFVPGAELMLKSDTGYQRTVLPQKTALTRLSCFPGNYEVGSAVRIQDLR
jgi:hypothetical protein